MNVKKDEVLLIQENSIEAELEKEEP